MRVCAICGATSIRKMRCGQETRWRPLCGARACFNAEMNRIEDTSRLERGMVSRAHVEQERVYALVEQAMEPKSEVVPPPPEKKRRKRRPKEPVERAKGPESLNPPTESESQCSALALPDETSGWPNEDDHRKLT